MHGRMWCLGLRLDAQGGGGGGGGDRSYLCSTQCVFAYPVGARAIGRVGARRFDAAGVSNAAPTGTVAKEASAHCPCSLQGDVGEARAVVPVFQILTQSNTSVFIVTQVYRRPPTWLFHRKEKRVPSPRPLGPYHEPVQASKHHQNAPRSKLRNFAGREIGATYGMHRNHKRQKGRCKRLRRSAQLSD